ncbi:MAG: TIR domain-containing protein [Ruminococcaceae bacterium]|nr:TIR domain-containing protein [Oscillospiraceae bacterium]
MALFKCKTCAGNILPNADGYTGVCEYCGTVQTLPKDKDEKIGQILNRANDFRLSCDYDRAIFEYEKVLELDETEPEAHWGIFLSRYGVEYVKDTMTLAYNPTLHRISSVSVYDDVDYQATLKYASLSAAEQYKADAEHIELVMKELLLLSANQEPYDIFLSYKELDDVTRQRTDDSYLAHDLYNELTAQGYKVFFAPKSLIGVALYEPNIYSAIISSKVMIVLGTKSEYLEGVWVKNEWSRFAEAIENGEDKVLIPVFKNMEASQFPNRIAKYQAYNMASMTFLPSLFDAIAKLIKRDSKIDFNRNASAEDAFVERGFIAIEDREFGKADSFFENALNLNPHSSQAYFGKLMVEMKINKKEQILTSSQPLKNYKSFEKAVRFADQQLKTVLLQYEEKVQNTIDEQEYNKAIAIINGKHTSQNDYEKAAKIFNSIIRFKDAKEKEVYCLEKIDEIKNNAVLCKAKSKMTGNYVSSYEEAIRLFKTIPGWKDSDEQMLVCYKKIDEINAKVEAERIERERIAEEERIEKERVAEEKCKADQAKAKRNKKLAMVITPIVAVVLVFVIVLTTVIIPNNKYNDAVDLMNDGKYVEAISVFEGLNGHKDSIQKIEECNNAILDDRYNEVLALVKKEKYNEAVSVIQLSDGEKNMRDNVYFCVNSLADNGEYDHTSKFLEECDKSLNLGEYTDELYFLIAEKCLENNDEKRAAIFFGKAGNYSDAKDRSSSLWDKLAIRDTFFSGYWYAVGVKTYGDVEQAGDYYSGGCEVEDWTDIVAVSGSGSRTVGLKSNGTVVVDCDKISEEYDLSSWTDIVAISAENSHTVGLKSDGTVVATGYNVNGQCEVSDWTDVVAISAGASHTVGLKSDGTVVATDFIDTAIYKDYGQCEVSDWTDIVAISAEDSHTVGLKSDGTVVAVGNNKDGRCNVEDWTDIVAISAAGCHTVGLKSDGTVVAVGDNKDGRCNVENWTDIVAVSAGGYHTVGLKSDGTVVAVGSNTSHSYDNGGSCDVAEWKDIVAVSAGAVTTMGLKSDGTVVIAGFRYKHSDWKDIKIPRK